MAREIVPRTQTPAGDPTQEIMNSFNDFIGKGAKNVLNRSLFGELGEVVWLRDEDGSVETEVQNNSQPPKAS